MLITCYIELKGCLRLCEKIREETGLVTDKYLKEMGIELILNGMERWNKGGLGNVGKLLLDRNR